MSTSSSSVDLLCGLVLLATAAAFLLVSRGFEEPDHTGVGPATFPTGIAALLALTSALLVFRGASGLMSRSTAIPRVLIGRPAWVLASILLVCVFPLLMPRLGYHLATAIWLPAFLFVAGYRKPIGILLCTLGFMLFTRIAFEWTLGVKLP